MHLRCIDILQAVFSFVTSCCATCLLSLQLFDEIAKTLPKVKYLKVYRLMHTRYQEVCQEQEAREVELERLYPEIKEVCIVVH